MQINLPFAPVQINLILSNIKNLFKEKNNKTVTETLNCGRYKKFNSHIRKYFLESIHEPLGTFLFSLKESGDFYYKKFLNPYGDLVYSKFRIDQCLRDKGLYYFKLDTEIVYIGRSHDPFGKRINYGYGNISPKNCYLDGQATNCHLNSLITENWNRVSFFVYRLDNNLEIDDLEKEFIRKLQPRWNVALKGSDF